MVKIKGYIRSISGTKVTIETFHGTKMTLPVKLSTTLDYIINHDGEQMIFTIESGIIIDARKREI